MHCAELKKWCANADLALVGTASTYSSTRTGCVIETAACVLLQQLSLECSCMCVCVCERARMCVCVYLQV